MWRRESPAEVGCRLPSMRTGAFQSRIRNSRHRQPARLEGRGLSIRRFDGCRHPQVRHQDLLVRCRRSPAWLNCAPHECTRTWGLGPLRWSRCGSALRAWPSVDRLARTARSRHGSCPGRGCPNRKSTGEGRGGWLEQNCPPTIRRPAEPDEGAGGGRRAIHSDPEAKLWLDRMAEMGWTAPMGPKKRGGVLDKEEVNVLAEQFRRIRCMSAWGCR